MHLKMIYICVFVNVMQVMFCSSQTEIWYLKHYIMSDQKKKRHYRKAFKLGNAQNRKAENCKIGMVMLSFYCF